MKPLSLRAVLAVAMLTTAIATPLAHAADPPQGSVNAQREAAERRADLVLWQRSGAASLATAASYTPGGSPSYEAARARYLQWRSGPEFDQEVQRQLAGSGKDKDK